MDSCGRDGDGERRIGVAMDYSYSASSKRTLEWAVRNLLRRADTLVVLIVHQPGGDEAKRATLWAKSGSPLIPLSEFREPAVMQIYGVRSIYARHHRAPARAQGAALDLSCMLQIACLVQQLLDYNNYLK
ncbi:hypothetical protein ACQ4PT_042733 [Festuca glaucescens]